MRSKTSVNYFDRYAVQQRLFEDWLPPEPCQICIVLPAYNEPDILRAVRSICSCDAPSAPVVLLIVINESVDENQEVLDQNLLTHRQLESFQQLPDWLILKYAQVTFPSKKSGVGLARKTGMDSAAYWFHQMQKNGVIACFDADSTCSKNFLIEVESHFKETHSASVCFYEHPINAQSGIIPYELHLRYYSNALRYAGYPNSFQTLGSCISVDSDTYIKAGGMNTRKAAEDFYFLHKVAMNNPITEINHATIYPSDRLSNRVPFGTGKALMGFKATNQLSTYALDAFIDLKHYFSIWKTVLLSSSEADISPRMEAFQKQQNFEEAAKKIIQQAGKNTTNLERQFFGWWDGLRVLKYIHYCRDQGDQMISPSLAITKLNKLFWREKLPEGEEALLRWIRAKDRDYKS